MNRRHGMEAMMGIGGGTVSSASQRNLDKAEDLCRKRKPKQAVPYLLKAIEDDHNLDAIIQAAFLMDRPSGLEILESAERRGRLFLKRQLGADCFDDEGDCVGRFWGLLETRPYMRVQQAIVRVSFEEKKYEQSGNTIIEMLRLCPGDNLGQRSWLGSILIRLGRFSDALSFAQDWLNDETSETGLPPTRGGTAFHTPHKILLNEKQETSHSKYGTTAILYTAAFAAFKLNGDDPQSQQYLRTSAKLNPHVFLKILARVQQPQNLNMDARTFNGPEEAQDYLWLTQDLWMVDDVWNWANSNPDVKNAVLKVYSSAACGVREVRVAEYKRCAACHKASYCSQACQKQDWPNHKPGCLEDKRMKAQIRAFQTRKPLASDIPMASTDFSNGKFFMKTPSGFS